MTRLLVETFVREGGGTVAFVCESSELLSSGACGGGVSERNAVMEAMNAYYNKTQPFIIGPDVVVPHQRDSVEPHSTPSTARIKRGAASTERIKELLIEVLSLDDVPQMQLGYSTENGIESSRAIVPIRVEQRRAGLGFQTDYLVALDVAKDEPRTFRMDRIERLWEL
jgi:hypothetical protein